MHRSVPLSLSFLVLALLSATTGCETAPRPELAWKPVAITDPSQVAGKWEGILRREPPTKAANDLVTILILHDGRFRFLSVRTIGVLSGEGTFSVVDSGLSFSSDRGSIDMTLFEADNQRMLKTKARSHDGFEYASDLTQVNAR